MLEHLPPGNAAQRELAGHWGDDQWIAHDISSQLRLLRADVYNALKGKNQDPANPDLLPTPDSPAEETVLEVAEVQSPKIAQDALLAVLGRADPH